MQIRQSALCNHKRSTYVFSRDDCTKSRKFMDEFKALCIRILPALRAPVPGDREMYTWGVLFHTKAGGFSRVSSVLNKVPMFVWKSVKALRWHWSLLRTRKKKREREVQRVQHEGKDDHFNDSASIWLCFSLLSNSITCCDCKVGNEKYGYIKGVLIAYGGELVILAGRSSPFVLWTT